MCEKKENNNGMFKLRPLFFTNMTVVKVLPLTNDKLF